MNFGFLTECYVRQGKSHTQAYADTFAQVDAAEAMGMDSIWMVEQHFRPWASIIPSPMVLGSAIAARTQRMRIGLAVQVLPLSNPLRIVEESNMLDQISQGRFDLGVGRSGITKFYTGYNVPLFKRYLPASRTTASSRNRIDGTRLPDRENIDPHRN